MRIDCGVCLVRSWVKDDIDPLVRHADNRNVWLQLRDRFPHPYTRERGMQWLASVAEASPEVSFAIDVEGEAVGGIGVVLQEDVDRASAEVGYWLGEPFWNRGLVTAALDRFTGWAFATFDDVHRLFAMPFARNAGSRRVLEKAGYELEAILKTSAIKDGELLDQALYARFRKR